MSITFNNHNIRRIYYGSSKLKSVYLGTHAVWERRLSEAVKWLTDSECRCDYYILRGKLYHKNGTQVGTDTGWTAVSGYSYNSLPNYGRAFGICNGRLYSISVTTATQIGTDTGWQTVSGFYAYYSAAQTELIGFGICNGAAYRLYADSCSRIGSRNDWTKIIACHDFALGIAGGLLIWIRNGVAWADSNSGWTAITGFPTRLNNTLDKYHITYGIYQGKLYSLDFNADSQENYLSRIQIGVSNEWAGIAGCSSPAGEQINNTTWYAVGICQGKLYSLSGTTATQIGTDTGWTAVSGSAAQYIKSYGICQGKLYSLSGTTATQIGTDTDWESICGDHQQDGESSYAYGIRDGKLYKLAQNTATLIG